MSTSDNPLKETPLADLHRALGAKLVPFAGYAMPVQYPAGVLVEHRHTREKAGLFDVSHMGQLYLDGPDAAACLETLVPGEIQALKPGRMRYTLLTNQQGGIIDDLMVTNLGNDRLFLVVNAGTKEGDIAHITRHLAGRVQITPLPDRALLALQGPQATEVLGKFIPAVQTMGFMTALAADFDDIPLLVTRSGYTGEDGYELSVAAEEADHLARLLLADPAVAPIGLGARDSLRLEAGLCLYGHDIDELTTPVEADLGFALGKRRRVEGGFPGADIILGQLASGSARKRVGILPDGKAPAREGTEIYADGEKIGTVTSGGFGPTLGGPIAMGYVATHAGTVGATVDLMIRGVARPAQIVALPFTPHHYYRAP